MNKLSKISKIFLFLSASSCTIWMGSYITRLSLFYQIFKANEFTLKEHFTEQNLYEIFKVLSPAVSVNVIFFTIMILSFIIFLTTSKLNLKQNGWLFISTVLIIITAPFEIYLMSIDMHILTQVVKDNFISNQILELVIKRFTILSSFPIVEILSYFAVIYLFIFQPLTKSDKKITE